MHLGDYVGIRDLKRVARTGQLSRLGNGICQRGKQGVCWYKCAHSTGLLSNAGSKVTVVVP